MHHSTRARLRKSNPSWGGTGVLMLPGLSYTAGAWRITAAGPGPRAWVLGYHEVLHTFVRAAATCQYRAIALFIV